MRSFSTPFVVVFLIVAVILGAVGGYLANSQLNSTPASQSAFLPYSDSFGGSIDESQGTFVTNSPLVAGFEKGQIAWYWLVGGTNGATNPVYFFNYQNGSPVTGQYPIIDVRPDEHGYTHFWHIFNVTVSNSYSPNMIKSLSSLNRAEQAGLASVSDSQRVLNGPLVSRNVKISVVNGEPLFLPVWYRTQASTMAVFETNLPKGNVPAISIWLIQRAGDSCPLLEALCNKDLNHDSDIKDSNDLIDTTPGQTGYYPLWAVSILHVKSTYPAPPSPFPQDPATLKAQGFFVSLGDAQADRSLASPVYVDLSVGTNGLTDTGNLVNCPALPLGVQPPAISF